MERCRLVLHCSNVAHRLIMRQLLHLREIDSNSSGSNASCRVLVCCQARLHFRLRLHPTSRNWVAKAFEVAAQIGQGSRACVNRALQTGRGKSPPRRLVDQPVQQTDPHPHRLLRGGASGNGGRPTGNPIGVTWLANQHCRRGFGRNRLSGHRRRNWRDVTNWLIRTEAPTTGERRLQRIKPR